MRVGPAPKGRLEVLVMSSSLACENQKGGLAGPSPPAGSGQMTDMTPYDMEECAPFV